MENKKEILTVKSLSISFCQYDKGFHQVELPTIQDLHVGVREGELVAVVGSSGSGKSLLAHGILGILPYNADRKGQLFYRGEELTAKRQKELRGREIVLVPQNVNYLNPMMRVGPQLQKGKRDPASKARAVEVLARYGLDEKVWRLYPFELSGGMTRRVLISTAVMEKPSLVIADEPTPGLHMDIARRVLGHFREIADEGAGVLLITHDLELALEVADRIVVFYSGTTVEDAPAAAFQRAETLKHPYTRALWQAMPQNGFAAFDGNQLPVRGRDGGCPYRPRCSWAVPACREEIPWREMGEGSVRCLAADG